MVHGIVEREGKGKGEDADAPEERGTADLRRLSSWAREQYAAATVSEKSVGEGVEFEGQEPSKARDVGSSFRPGQGG
jgi:hypothetical protein